MRLRPIYLATVGMLTFSLADKSAQDARPWGQRAYYELTAGRFEEALTHYRRGLNQMDAAGIGDLRFRYLANIGACELSLFRFRDASRTLLQVRAMASAAGNQNVLAGVDANLAGLFRQMGDYSAAEHYARGSVEAYAETGKPEESTRARLILADILSLKRLTAEAEQIYATAIADAQRGKDWPVAFAGWLHYGRALLENNRLPEADQAFGESLRALVNNRRATGGEEALFWNLARLRLMQKDVGRALSSINEALDASVKAGSHMPPWRLYHTRAEIQLAAGRPEAALSDARQALKWARTVRANVVPDGDNRVGFESVLDRTVSILIESAHRVYRKSHDPKLLRETFEAAEDSRAEVLQALLQMAGDWRERLSTPEYRYLLSRLLKQQRNLMRADSAEGRERLTRLQAELLQMESKAGVTVSTQSGAVLDRVRQNLPEDAALLSFRLGERVSWLWAVDQGRLEIYPLPGKAVLIREMADFQAALQANDSQRIWRLGRQLYIDLFGKGRSFEGRSHWYISLDESLYSLPLPALVVAEEGDRPVFLTQRKTVQIVPGAQLLRSPVRKGFSKSRFVLAGDGIYNRADPRYEKKSVVRPASWVMARLPGSGEEVRTAAGLWRQASMLTGALLTKQTLLREIDRDPDVIHIASHVIEGQDRWRSGMLALGIDANGEPDLLTTREIQLHPIHSRLVVMSGCSSAAGETVAASGLMGLTRAWLAAGADEVLATRWPSRDESGDGLIGSFYRHLLSSRSGNVPEALRMARQEMIVHGGWRAEPRYWSSFFVIGVR